MTPGLPATVDARRVTGLPPGMCRRSFPGRPDQVPQVRAFVTQVLTGCPAAGEVVLMADELAANAVLHSRSGEPGGLFTVQVEMCDGQWVRVAVTDEGGPTPPRLRGDGHDSAGPAGHASTGNWVNGDLQGGEADAGGRGLRIVAALAGAWGVSGDVVGRTVWFRTGWGTA